MTPASVTPASVTPQVRSQTAGMGEARPVLTANFLWTLAGNSIYALCQWTILMSFAKLGNAEMLGQYALGLAITAPVFQFCGLQLRTVQVTDARNRYTFSELAGMRMVTTLGALFICAALSLWGRRPGSTATVVILIGFSKAVESLSDLAQGLFQKNERMDRVAKSLVFKGIFSALAVALALKFFGGAVAAAGALVIAWTLVWGVYDLRTAISMLPSPKAVLPRIGGRMLRDLFLLTLPLGFVMLVLSLNSNLPRYFLAKYSGEASVGVFSALTYGIVAGNMVMGALGQAASPRLARLHYDGDRRAFCGLVMKLAAFGGLTGLAGLVVVQVAGARILTMLYRPEYALHVKAFFWLMAAGAIMNISGVLGVAMTAMQGFRQQAWIHLACLAIGLAAAFALVPSMGILGAAFSVLILALAGLIGFAVKLVLMLADDTVAVPRLAISR